MFTTDGNINHLPEEENQLKDNGNPAYEKYMDTDQQKKFLNQDSDM